MKNNAQLLMPREKMLKFGISALTDVELLALFLRTGTRGKDVLTLAKEMLENFGSLYGLLTSEYEQFSGVHGIGVAKFAQLKGIAELARRYYNVRMREESPLLSPEMTREFLQSQCIDSLEVRKKPGGHWIIRDLMGLDLVGLASL